MLATRAQITAERKAHVKAQRLFAAKQVGPFFCIVCKTESVPNFDAICDCCDRHGKVELADWYKAKPDIVGTF